jgi:hypothetical protein
MGCAETQPRGVQLDQGRRLSKPDQAARICSNQELDTVLIGLAYGGNSCAVSRMDRNCGCNYGNPPGWALHSLCSGEVLPRASEADSERREEQCVNRRTARTRLEAMGGCRALAAAERFDAFSALVYGVQHGLLHIQNLNFSSDDSVAHKFEKRRISDFDTGLTKSALRLERPLGSQLAVQSSLKPKSGLTMYLFDAREDWEPSS